MKKIFQTLKSGIFREVMDSEKDGRLLFVTTTDYMRVAEELVTGGDHVLVVEENTGRSLRSDLFSRAGLPPLHIFSSSVVEFYFMHTEEG